MAVTEIYLIRHAESVMNTRSHLIGGRSNETPLTPKGAGQARQLGRYFLAEGIIPDRCYASPAVRTLQTATNVLGEMGISQPLAILDDLQELDQGSWVGQPRAQIYTPDVLAEIGRIGKDFKAADGESMNDVGARMLRCIAAEIDQNPPTGADQRIFIFGHGMAIRCLASTLHDWSHAETYNSVTPNASFSLIIQDAKGMRLDYLGRTAEPQDY